MQNEDLIQQKQVGKFIIKELSVGAMIVIIDKASSPDDAIRREFQLDLMKLSVFNLDDTPMDVDKVPFRTYIKLLPEVLAINGLGGSKDEGK